MASRIPYSRSSWPVYSEDPAWSDIDPLSQDDGSDPLAAIAYTEEYSEAMAYLRAVMAKNEMSERGLELTEHMISLNPAHYTVWYALLNHYRSLLDNAELECSGSIELKHSLLSSRTPKTSKKRLSG